jgi:isopenicillin-N epimerase
MAGAKPKLRVAPDDETYWLSIRATLNPLYSNTQLVNTRRGPAPLSVRNKVRELVDLSLSYELDEYEPFVDMKESGSSLATRTLLADYFGTTADEIALTRNAMEGIATVLNGFVLKPGDEVVATNLCYDSNLVILRQRAQREDIIIKTVELPLGPISDSDILALFDAAIGERTKLVSLPHVFSMTGLVLPVKAISDLARQRGAFTFVDGAHSAGHLDFRIDELGCDGFAACLHKWMNGPRGTGFLYVKKEQIENVWPLFAPWSGKSAHSIEKFEEVGTVFKALPGAIPETMAFNKDIGQAEKAARLRYLRSRWAIGLKDLDRVRFLTDLDAVPGTGFGAFVVDGLDGADLASILLEEYQINVKDFELDRNTKGIHLSPSIANTVEEIDRFVDATLSIMNRASASMDVRQENTTL